MTLVIIVFFKNTIYSDKVLDKTLNIVYNWFHTSLPDKMGRDGFFNPYGRKRATFPRNNIKTLERN